MLPLLPLLALLAGGSSAGSAVVPVAPVVLSTHVVATAPVLHAVTVPTRLAPAPAGANLKLWLYDPRSGAALATGIFVRNVTDDGAWQFVGAHADGSLYLQLAAGTRHEFDGVEPTGLAGVLSRHRYQVAVSADGIAVVTGVSTETRGVHAVTLDMAMEPATPAVAQARAALMALAERPAADFVPTSPCQVMDGNTPTRSMATDVAAGFPKVRVRLPSSGHVRALIIPVDFPDVAGRVDPGRLFAPLAVRVRDFYVKQSYGGLALDFDIVPNWVHLPFTPSRYGFGRAVGAGDFTSYRRDVVAMVDGQIDFSRYDAVYILVPPTMPMDEMGWGPTITAPIWTRTGYVVNGATGGADMYNNKDGAWRWMAHETGHALGLIDEDLDHRTQTLGHWGIMAMNWSLNAIEHNAWDRWLQGWLPQAQVACLSPAVLKQAATSVTLSPLVRQDGGVKAIMVPLGTSKILVLESRRNEGDDHIASAQEGVLVYTVDTSRPSLGGGYRTQRRPGSTDPNFEDAALHPGDVIAVDGVEVRVTASARDGDTVALRNQ
jgi:M6 family metalloprotease-like protein